jgi:hypothetical protein
VLGTSCIGHDDGGEVRVTVAGGGEEIDCPMVIEAIGLLRMSSCYVEIQDAICLMHRTGSKIYLTINYYEMAGTTRRTSPGHNY